LFSSLVNARDILLPPQLKGTSRDFFSLHVIGRNIFIFRVALCAAAAILIGHVS
jgi:hypothetical protein